MIFSPGKTLIHTCHSHRRHGSQSPDSQLGVISRLVSGLELEWRSSWVELPVLASEPRDLFPLALIASP